MQQQEKLHQDNLTDVDELMAQLDEAINRDLECNKRGLPGINKLKCVDVLLTKLKNKNMQHIFLEKDGLDILNRYITRLPDGSWPLSSVRKKILSLIYDLPIQIEHLKSTLLGRTLSILQTSPHEHQDNKKAIQNIKDKWSRVICNISVEYTALEQYEV